MFLILTVVLSVTIVTISYLRKTSIKKEVQQNEELDKYYTLVINKAPPQACYKQLVVCSSVLITELYNLEKEQEVLEPLYKDRIISEKTYTDVCDKIRNLSIDRLVLENETQVYGKNCFKEARLGACTVPREYRISEDPLFQMKRDALELDLYKRITSIEM